MRRILALLLVACAALFAQPALALPVSARPAPLRVLYLDQSVGWKHAPVARPADGGLAPSETAMIAIGQESGVFTAEVTQDAREITPERLAKVDVLVLYTTGALPLSPEAWAEVQKRVAAGKLGFVGLHSATDTGWPYDGPGETYTRFINGHFAGHPWTQGTPIRVETLDPDARLTAMWSVSFDYAEEIYQHSDFDPSKVRVLQTLDFAGTALKRPYAVPIAWARQIGQGRLFFTNLGHTPSTWNDPRFEAQIIEAVLWTGGRTDGDATPDPLRQFLWQLKALLGYEPAPGRDDKAIIGRLLKMDPVWQKATAQRIADLRAVYPNKPDIDRAPFDAAYKAVLAEVLAKGGVR
ncbi:MULTISPECIES: ThuA domain-containing protein [unclassified Caulobacter]|uniref:ThuA domain-containing protein n=1 Tax=unclassified Caulobacter TaxID=2648921 RepID=UPI0004A6E805|nr:ThuA domain-containing protein [Caulobacter sp. UNC358MFTsu5.1]